MTTLFPAPEIPTIPVRGEDAVFPINRIFCVGRNYAAHAAEMGYEVDREAPFFFTKSPAHAVPTGQTQPYPPGTENYHFEMELAVALGAPIFRGDREAAEKTVYAFGSALDMTRRDLQINSRNIKRPWDFGKDVEGSAVFSPMTKARDFGPVARQRIWLTVNGETKQDSTLDLLIHDVPAVISYLSEFYHLVPGDVILTGTPEGVGPVVAGDVIEGGIDGLDPISLTIGPAD